MFLVLGIVVVVLLVFVASIYNGLISKRNRIDEAAAGIEAHMQERFDNITTQAETVLSFIEHEDKVLTRIVELRQRGFVPQTMSEKAELDEALSAVQSRISVIAEEYPTLTSGENFEMLQRSINVVEEKISAARRAYNSAVRAYNDGLQVFPNNIIVGLFGARFPAYEMYEAQEQAKERVSVRSMLKR